MYEHELKYPKKNNILGIHLNNITRIMAYNWKGGQDTFYNYNVFF